MQGKKLPGVDKKDIRRSGVVFTECAHIVPQSTYFDASMPTGSPEKVRPRCVSASAVVEFIVTPESVGCFEAFRL
jgi:hypothetical protein